MSENAEVAKKSRTYLVLVCISLVYIGIYYLLMKETEACDPLQFSIKQHWFHGFWDKYLACRSINELGDALAGAFAPVAFIWLAGTVFIQSQELREQRLELIETQGVMREQLEVARAQVEETKASTALLNAQTNLISVQHQYRVADDEFDKTVYRARVELTKLSQKFGYTQRLSGTDEISSKIGGGHFPHISDPDFFADLSELLTKNLDRVRSTKFETVSIDNETSWEYFRELFARLAQLTEECSPAYHNLAMTYCVHEIHNSLETLYGLLDGARRNQAGAPVIDPPGMTPV